MFHSLRSRITIALLFVAIGSVTVIGVLFKNVATMQFQVYLSRDPTLMERFFFPHSLPPVHALIGLAEEQYLAALRSSLWQAGVGVTLISGVIGFGLAYRLSKPLDELTKAAAEIAKQQPGQLTDLAPKPRLGRGEVDRLSRAFHAMAESLDRQEQHRRQFLANIAHELRTPLTILHGRLEALLDGVIEATPQELDSLHTQSLLLVRLVNDLEMLALAQAQALSLDLQRIHPADVMHDIASAHAVVAEHAKIHFQVDVPDNLPTVTADRQRLTQVLHNLVTNALRSCESGDTVTLRVAAATAEEGRRGDVVHSLEDEGNLARHGVVFSVIDTGEGIPKEALASLFDPFTRIDPSRTRQSGGTGLGLAIVRYLVEAHEGSVAMASAEGVGTRVTVWLPKGSDREQSA